MPKKTLTDQVVKRIKPPESGRIEYFDSSMPSFGIRVSHTGRKTWILFYRYHGRQKRLSLGTYPAKTLADARKEAIDAQRLIESDKDPGEFKAKSKQQDKARSKLFADVKTDFIQRYAKRKTKQWQQTEYLLNKEVIPAWGKREIQNITRRDVHNLLDGIIDRGKPYLANRVLAAIRKLFNWAIDRDIIESSPVVGIKPPGKEKSRERVLSHDELKAIWEASEQIGYPFGPLYKLLILTGQRLNEVAKIRWSDINKDERLWTLSSTKNQQFHQIPITGEIQAILDNLPSFKDGEYVLSTTCGKKPVSGFSRAKAQIDKLSGVENWRNHDLRRTFVDLRLKLTRDLH